jgi:hypothetical protein
MYSLNMFYKEMPVERHNSEGERTRVKKTKVIYSNYITHDTLFNNGQVARAPVIVSGTGASGEYSALINIIEGEVNMFPDCSCGEETNTVYISRFGSISFSPGSYLTSGLTPDFSMGTSNFTLECWARTNTPIGGGWTNLITIGSASGNDIRLAAGGDFYAPNGGNIGFIVPTPGNTDDARYRTASTMSNNTWYHFALVRTGSNIKFYINGVSQRLTDDSNGTQYANGVPVSFNHGSINGSNLFINSSVFNESNFNGLISNIRLVRGFVIYSENFTAPVEPLTVLGDTRLLLNTADTTNYLIDSSIYNRTLSIVGEPAYSSTNPFS